MAFGREGPEYSDRVPPVSFRNGQRTTGPDDRVDHAAARLAQRMWRGGGDEDYHFLLYLCADVVRTVQEATDEFDGRDISDQAPAPANADPHLCQLLIELLREQKFVDPDDDTVPRWTRTEESDGEYWDHPRWTLVANLAAVIVSAGWRPSAAAPAPAQAIPLDALRAMAQGEPLEDVVSDYGVPEDVVLDVAPLVGRSAYWTLSPPVRVPGDHDQPAPEHCTCTIPGTGADLGQLDPRCQTHGEPDD
jgi:hypothetical protein